MSQLYYQSPIGALRITGDDSGIKAVEFVAKAIPSSGWIPDLVNDCRRQLEEYFRGERKKFDLKLSLDGTPFQRQVWQQLLRIPYGETASYGAIALILGKKGAARAVGGANHRNPVAVIVPCHRVIGSHGGLTGYGGGLWRKEWLLKHEKKI